MRHRATAGFTLVEMLIAGALLVVLLTVVGFLFGSTSRAYELNRNVTDASGQLRSAVNALRYDLSMAGFTGIDDEAAERDLSDPVSLTFSGTGDGNGRPIGSLSVRYVETRFTQGGGNVEQLVTFRLNGTDLERRVGTGSFRVVASDIEGLELVGYRRASGSKLAADNPLPADLTGFDLRLRYLQAGNHLHEDFSVTLLNPL